MNIVTRCLGPKEACRTNCQSKRKWLLLIVANGMWFPSNRSFRVILIHVIRCALLLRRLLLRDVISNVDLIFDVLPFGRLC
jgi:hypothetical protein